MWLVSDLNNLFPQWTDSADSLQLVINAASEAVESFCHDKFVQRTETLVYDGNDKLTLDLFHRWSAITSVFEGDNGSALPGATNVSTLKVRDPVNFPYVLYRERGLLVSLFKWKFGVQNIQVIGTTGMATAINLPAELRNACLQIIRQMHDSGLGSGVTIGPPLLSEKVGEYSYTYGAAGVRLDDLPVQTSTVLLRYRRFVVA
jgi:hypothetical protein